jgi:hypothetical protein
MIVRSKARELIAGIADDPTFGPIIVFGRGGTAVEVIGDKALALPPLDLELACELIGRTRLSRVLKAYRDVPPQMWTRSRSCWSSWRNSLPTCPSCAGLISIPCWRIRTALSPSMPAWRWLRSTGRAAVYRVASPSGPGVRARSYMVFRRQSQPAPAGD